ncbi:MAG: hypothetical protein ABSH16_08170 [Sedimentisphaerales bacterium]
MWVLIQDVNSSKGKPIYAAVRIIDNGGMLNVNTGFKFDPSASVGASQMDINLMAFAALDKTHDTYIGETQDRLFSYRCGSEPFNNSLYMQNVIWRYGLPNGAYTPFDISDELKLRNRYIINYNLMTSRIETLWTNGFDGSPFVPRDPRNYSITTPADWFWIVSNNYPSPCPDPCTYDNRHIATTYNCDRVITPAGDKMVNINTAEPNAIREAIWHGLVDANAPGDVNGTAAQIAANIVDYRDDDNDVTIVRDYSGNPHFGFERPCIYISEIAQNFYQDSSDPPNIYHSYAIELFKPYPDDVLPDSNWQLVIDSIKTIQVNWSGSTYFHVFLDDVSNPISVAFKDANGNIVPGVAQPATGSLSFDSNSVIELQRKVYDPCTGTYSNIITVDKVVVPPAGANWLQIQIAPATPATYSFQRDISSHKPIRRLWDTGLSKISPPTLGGLNSYTDNNDTRIIQAHPANNIRFTNVGEIGQLFYAPTYYYGGVGPDFTKSVTEPELRIDLNEPAYQQIFKYLTVMDPCDHGPQAANESRIKGRININTAPWFVIAQLPWISYHTPNYDLARAIVDKREIRGGYKSIGELMADANSSINNIGYYQDNPPVPAVLMTPADGSGDKFEQRDVIFDRNSRSHRPKRPAKKSHRDFRQKRSAGKAGKGYRDTIGARPKVIFYFQFSIYYFKN